MVPVMPVGLCSGAWLLGAGASGAWLLKAMWHSYGVDVTVDDVGTVVVTSFSAAVGWPGGLDAWSGRLFCIGVHMCSVVCRFEHVVQVLVGKICGSKSSSAIHVWTAVFGMQPAMSAPHDWLSLAWCSTSAFLMNVAYALPWNV